MAKYTQLKYGASGDEVKKLQTQLNNKGYTLTVDGVWGDKTDAAVRKYQKDSGLTVDGIVGDITWGSLLGQSTSGNNAAAADPKFEYKDFSYGDYKESDTVTQAQAALNAQLAQKPGAYQSQWQAQLDDTINKILNREEFSYDLNGDALYQQYKDKYIQQGKLAMQDTMGQAAAMTGGYGNSYAQSVGQQAYAAQLDNLNDIVPELQQMAYDRYNQEGQELLNQYAILGERENADYGRYQDELSAYLAERDYLSNRYDAERDYDYSKYADERNFAYDKYSNDKSYAYEDYRNAIADKQWEKSYALNERQVALDEQKYADSKTVYETVGGNSGGNSGGTGKDSTGKEYNYDNGGIDSSKIAEIQKALGVTADGKWGPKSQAAAGGLSAKEAWQAYQNGELKGSNPGSGFTGKTYEEAVDFMESKGVPSGTATRIMTASEWNRRKSSYQLYGQGGSEVVNYDSYADYLADFVEYALETSGR